MSLDNILSTIDAELARLQQARALLAGSGTPGRTPVPKKRKRRMSAVARKRTGDAQRKRWVKQRKAAK
jgi:hypothetical protein